VLARTFPEAAVMEAFKEIDGVIMEYWDRMPGDKKVRMDALCAIPPCTQGTNSA
jgi:hypothetical protein